MSDSGSLTTNAPDFVTYAAFGNLTPEMVLDGFTSFSSFTGLLTELEVLNKPVAVLGEELGGLLNIEGGFEDVVLDRLRSLGNGDGPSVPELLFSNSDDLLAQLQQFDPSAAASGAEMCLGWTDVFDPSTAQITNDTPELQKFLDFDTITPAMLLKGLRKLADLAGDWAGTDLLGVSRHVLRPPSQ